jgi:hypothetical protein
MAAAMTDHIQNNPFGRSTDGHRDDWPAVQVRRLGARYLRLQLSLSMVSFLLGFGPQC